MLSVLPAPDSPLREDVRRAGGRFTKDVRDEDTLVLSLLAHIHPRTFSDREDVGRVLITALPPILVYDGIRVEGKSLVRINSN